MFEIKQYTDKIYTQNTRHVHIYTSYPYFAYVSSHLYLLILLFDHFIIIIIFTAIGFAPGGSSPTLVHKKIKR
jgi:hypothetical protein